MRWSGPARATPCVLCQIPPRRGCAWHENQSALRDQEDERLRQADVDCATRPVTRDPFGISLVASAPGAKSPWSELPQPQLGVNIVATSNGSRDLDTSVIVARSAPAPGAVVVRLWINACRKETAGKPVSGITHLSCQPRHRGRHVAPLSGQLVGTRTVTDAAVLSVLGLGQSLAGLGTRLLLTVLLTVPRSASRPSPAWSRPRPSPCREPPAVRRAARP